MPSLTDHVTPVECRAYVVAALWSGGKAAFALGDGTLKREGDVLPLHKGAVLAALSDHKQIVTSGEDGKVLRITGDDIQIVSSQPGRWVDALALSPKGALAFASGREVTCLDGKATKSWQAPASIRGLSFAPKGMRLALAHYNGVSLWYPNVLSEPEQLIWKGSHLDVVWSPDGRFVISTMQENALHGWRLDDAKHMRMTGYPGKTRSLSWSHDAQWLASSGAEAVILWSFETKDGPMGKAPRECAVRSARVSRVDCHPRLPILAAGYEDGFVVLVRMTDQAELLVQRETGSPITALSFDKEGNNLAFGAQNGTAGILTLP